MTFKIEKRSDHNGWRHYIITGAGLPANCEGLRMWMDRSNLVAEHFGIRKPTAIELAVNIAKRASIDEVDALVADYFNQDACSVSSSWMKR